jgi:molybdenum cofactor cytidylyltransferase
MLCDQPGISTNHLEKMFYCYQTEKFSCVASVYQGVKGVPALFDKQHFNDLLNLKGDWGARKIIESLGANAGEIEFQAGVLDIDTIEDYRNYWMQLKV